MKQPTLKATLGLIAALACIARAAIAAGGFSANTSTLEAPAGVIGEVVAVTHDQTTCVLTVKTDSGATVSIVVDETTEVKRLPANERSIENSQTIQAADVAPGDRVYARGAHPDGSGTARARQLIVMSRIDIQQRRERERREWQGGVAGVVIALNRQAKEITLLQPGGTAVAPLVVTASASAFRRYAPDSVRFSDARPSSFEEMKVGDQLRARGERSTDGGRFTAREVVSGSFVTLAGAVTGISPETGEVKVKLLGNNQQVTVVVSKDSNLRRISQQTASLIARKGAGALATRAASDSEATGGGEGRVTRDSQELLDRLPPFQLTEMRPGEVIAVSSTVGRDLSRFNAISLVAGVDALIVAVQKVKGSPRMPALSTGLPPGVLDFALGQP